MKIAESARRKRMTGDEIIALIQAFKEGKTVQSRFSAETPWRDNPDPSWDFVCVEWRVKPD